MTLEAQTEAGPSARLVVLLAVACGLTAANIYYAQPLLPLLKDDFGVTTVAAGWLVTLVQLGYAAGMLFLVPLGDRLERCGLVVALLAVATAALVVAGTARSFGVLLGGMLVVGAVSVTAQILVPFAADLAPDAIRGRVVGRVMSGLLAGILLSRVVSSAAAGLIGWRGVYLCSAGLMALLAVAIWRTLPSRRPATALSYGRLLASTGALVRRHPLLRRRALYQAAMFGSFSVFWSTAPYLLTGPSFGYSSAGVALFALVGAGGAAIAPMAGRWADRGLGRLGSGVCFLAGGVAFALFGLGAHSIVLLVLGAILLDMAVQANFIFGQHSIYRLDGAARSRLNSAYLATFFTGGAIGAQLGSAALHSGGWWGVVACGGALPLLAFLAWLPELRRAPRSRGGEQPRRSGESGPAAAEASA